MQPLAQVLFCQRQAQLFNIIPYRYAKMQLKQASQMASADMNLLRKGRNRPRLLWRRRQQILSLVQCRVKVVAVTQPGRELRVISGAPEPHHHFTGNFQRLMRAEGDELTDVPVCMCYIPE